MHALKFVFAFLLCFSFSAGAVTWQINKDHSELLFQVSYLTVSEVTGRFTSFTGQVEFPENGSVPERIFISVDTSSLDTGNRQRDGHLRTQEFLKSKTHPYMTFESQEITPLKAGQLRAKGTLTLGGVAKPMSIDFSLSESMKDTWNYENRFAKFRSTINRTEYGINWNKTLQDNKYLVGENITFWGTVQLQPTGQGTPASKHMIPDTAYIRKREKLLRGEISQDEFDRETGASAVISPGASTPTIQSEIPETLVEDKPAPDRDVRDRPLWQLSFWTLGLFGFFSSIIMGLYIKKIVSEKYPEKYSEGGWFGLLTDSLSIPIMLFYALALWEVGWG